MSMKLKDVDRAMLRVLATQGSRVSLDKIAEETGWRYRPRELQRRVKGLKKARLIDWGGNFGTGDVWCRITDKGRAALTTRS
jgi:hypothetical protein